jgi:hypothetical protein
MGRVDQHYPWNLACGFALGSLDCKHHGAVEFLAIGALVLVLALHEIRNMRSVRDMEPH